VRPGVRLACDVGSARIGLARSDAQGMMAVPLEAIRAGDDAIGAVVRAVSEWDAIDVYVGLPLHLSGAEGAAAGTAREWAGALAERTAVPVRLIDERLSTVQAQKALRAGGRSTRQSRSLIDSASAVVVLQSVLEQEQRTGRAPGERVRTRHDDATLEGKEEDQ
jgi:putative Holliday junction resolvase